MPEVTRTVVSCPHCHESFSLSPENSIELLKKLEIQVECPACRKPAHISAITRARLTPPVRQRQVPAKAVPPEPVSPPTRVGLPPFKPLGSDAAAAFGAASAGGIPFEPLKAGSKAPKGGLSHASTPGKGIGGWWSGQTRLTQGLLLAVLLLVPGLIATLVLLHNHIAEYQRLKNLVEPDPALVSPSENDKAAKAEIPGGKLNISIPSEASSANSQPVSRN